MAEAAPTTSTSLSYTCQLCDPPAATYSWKNKLKAHYQRVHKQVPESFHLLPSEKRPKLQCPHCNKEMAKLTRHKETCKMAPKEAEPVPSTSGTVAQTRRQRRQKDEDEIIEESEPEESLNRYTDVLPIIARRLAEIRGFQKVTIDKYITSLRELNTFSGKKRTNYTNLERSLTRHYWHFIEKRPTVSEREVAWKAITHLANFMRYTVREPVANILVQTYLESKERHHLFQTLDGMATEDKRKFLLAETLLATQSEAFVRQLSLKDFRENWSKTPNGEWSYTAMRPGQDVTCTIPTVLRLEIIKYNASGRRELLGQEKAADQDLKVFGHPSQPWSDVIIDNTIWQWLEDVSRAHFYFGKAFLKSLTMCQFNYKPPTDDGDLIRPWQHVGVGGCKPKK